MFFFSSQEWLEKISSKVDAFLLEICLKFDFDKYIIVSVRNISFPIFVRKKTMSICHEE
jgi:hypothetical protein